MTSLGTSAGTSPGTFPGIPPGTDLWIASGHQLCDRDAAGRLLPTPDLWRAFLARPELRPEGDPAEQALHASLLAQPLRPVPPDALAALADPDAAENWALFLGFRDRVAAAPSLEAAWCDLYAGPLRGIPPLLLQMLSHLVTRAALEGETDPFVWRAAELFFRPQRAALHQGALLLADEEALETAGGGDLGPLGRLLAEAGAPPPEVTLDVLGLDNAAAYATRSNGHDFALDIAEDRPGQAGLARALERFLGHVLGLPARIRPVPLVEEAPWHVGLDAEAMRIANTLYQGGVVPQAELARLLWLGVLEFGPGAAVLPRMAGRPVLLALAMDAAGGVRLKPQNLLAGLPLLRAAAA